MGRVFSQRHVVEEKKESESSCCGGEVSEHALGGEGVGEIASILETASSIL